MARSLPRAIAAGTAFLAVGVLATAGGPTLEPFAFLGPAISIESSDRTKLDAGKAVVKVLPAGERDLTIFAAVRVDAPGERLIAWMRQIEQQKNRYVPVIVRFSNPPRIEDLNALTLSDTDLEAIRDCRPGRCGVQLSATEIAQLQQALEKSSHWKAGVQAAFRHVILSRVQGYLAEGHFAAPAYDDERSPIFLEDEFAKIVRRFGFLTLNLPQVTDYLQLYPRVTSPNVTDSFLYWSTETLGDAKPITSVTHVSIVCNDDPRLPEVLVVAKQVFATHYLSGALAMTAVTNGSAGRSRYLLYVNGSRVDVFDGVFGGLVRRIVERRIRAEAPDVIHALRRRLEGGDPPSLPRIRSSDDDIDGSSTPSR